MAIGAKKRRHTIDILRRPRFHAHDLVSFPDPAFLKHQFHSQASPLLSSLSSVSFPGLKIMLNPGGDLIPGESSDINSALAVVTKPLFHRAPRPHSQSSLQFHSKASMLFSIHCSTPLPGLCFVVNRVVCPPAEPQLHSQSSARLQSCASVSLSTGGPMVWAPHASSNSTAQTLD